MPIPSFHFFLMFIFAVCSMHKQAVEKLVLGYNTIMICIHHQENRFCRGELVVNVRGLEAQLAQKSRGLRVNCRPGEHSRHKLQHLNCSDHLCIARIPARGSHLFEHMISQGSSGFKPSNSRSNQALEG